ncbi:MAG: prephenate dehydrogenase [Microbacteriaceae bacterium]|nr:prephenate dehydrogenase [Microbacteriaceae bacterium]
MNGSRMIGEVRVVGAGLLGASIGLGLRAIGVDVIVHDSSPVNLSLAIDYGAGRAAKDTDIPRLIVVAVPPDVTALVVAAELAAFPNAIVTDVASVKVSVLEDLRATGADILRYIGSHPLAGRERGGPISARGDLFIGRPWVVTPHDDIPAAQIGVIEDLVLDLGAIPILMTAEQHDSSVALVSHLPQVVSSLLARRLLGGTESALALSGQGLRDTSRVASSSPELWVQILGANSASVVGLLREYRTDLDALIDALDAPSAPGARRAVAEMLAGGNAGVARIPGKHGQDRRFSQIIVMVDDKPGELARLLTEIGDIGVNLEDLRLEHAPGVAIGFAEIAVVPEAEAGLVTELEARGWRIAEVAL